MRSRNTLTLLVLLIILAAVPATITGIFSSDGPGNYTYQSVRGKTVVIYGKGLYKHMSAEVAPQGIAQDHVTLVVGIPLLIISFIWAGKGSLRGQYLLAGTLGYFFVTYLFYTVMGMYNAFFLAYVLLMGCSFFALLLTLSQLNNQPLLQSFHLRTPVKLTGGFLIFNSIAIALLWLSIVVPPLVDGSIIPVQVEHYTTLIVQGLDLGLLLPVCFICGVLLIKKLKIGFLLAPVYYIFLSILLTALTAKVLAMKHAGYNVIPVIFIIPAMNAASIVGTIILLRNIRPQKNKITNRGF